MNKATLPIYLENDNPYEGNSDNYVFWYDGWNEALINLPELEPKE